MVSYPPPSHRACYLNGALMAQRTGDTPEPKPCAGNNGTTITVSSQRLNSMSGPPIVRRLRIYFIIYQHFFLHCAVLLKNIHAFAHEIRCAQPKSIVFLQEG